MCSRSGPPSGAKTARQAGLRTEHLRPAQHHVGQVLEPGGVGEFGGDLGDRRRPLQGCQPLAGLLRVLRDVEDGAQDAAPARPGVPHAPGPA